MAASRKRIILGISGASGAILGVRALEMLRSLKFETHLIITESAKITIPEETSQSIEQVQSLASAVYDNNDIGQPLSSGSFDTQGMLVVPCSIKTLSAVANAYTPDLLTRAADVTLKEGRPLLLAVRETPLHPGHIRLMQIASQSGAIIFPPVPAFYNQPGTVDEMVTRLVGRMLARVGIPNENFIPWGGLNQTI
jgi:4-hydroxy-3-polyprenylbenzoate decarboxylase